VSAFSTVDTPTLSLETINSYGFHGRVDFPETVFMVELLCPLKFFRIDDPRDPANKYLNHACVESSEFKTVYDGIAVLDEQGEAVVQLPEWFDALNGNFRYQLTPLGAAAPELHIAEKISGNRFRISGGPVGLEVCWQVTGVRKDKVAEANPVIVEQDKPVHERGFYLHPELHGESQERSILRAREQVSSSRAEETRQERLERGKELIAAQRRSLAEYRRRVEEHARAAGTMAD
jgi:hypothetical protein